MIHVYTCSCLQPRELWFINFNHVYVHVHVAHPMLTTFPSSPIFTIIFHSYPHQLPPSLPPYTTGLQSGAARPLPGCWSGKSTGHTAQETVQEDSLLCLLSSWWTALVGTCSACMLELKVHVCVCSGTLVSLMCTLYYAMGTFLLMQLPVQYL